MEKEDSFPQRVWQIVAAIPEGYRDRPAPRARWAVC